MLIPISYILSIVQDNNVLSKEQIYKTDNHYSLNMNSLIHASYIAEGEKWLDEHYAYQSSKFDY